MKLSIQLSQNTFRTALLGIFITTFAGVFYGPALARTYGVLDDFLCAYEAQSGLDWFHLTSGFARIEVATGRLIPAILFSFIWGNVTSLEDLDLVRFFGLLVVCSGVIALTIWARRLNRSQNIFRDFVLLLGSVMILVLPSVTATVTWAQKATQLVALPLSIFSGILATKTGSLTKFRWTLIIVLNLASAFSYQHFTTLATLPVFIWAAFIFIASHDLSGVRRSFSISLISFFSLIVNYLFVWIRNQDVIPEGPTFTTKINDLFLRQLPKSLHIFIETTPFLVGLSVTVFLSMLLIVVLWTRNSWPYLLAVFMSAGLSSLITLGGNRDASYRLVMPTQLTLWMGLLLVLSLVIQSDRSRSIRMRVALIGILIASVTLTTLDAKTTVYTRISDRNRNQWKIIYDEVENLSNAPTPKKIIVSLVPLIESGNCATHSEIGLLGWHEGWVLRDQFAYAFLDFPNGKILAQIPLEILDHDQDLPDSSEDTYVINLLNRDTC